MDKQKILKKYYHYMKPQKCVLKKCNFKYLITGKLRLTTTFRRCRCIYLAPPPHVCANTVPSEVQLLQTRVEGGGGGGVWYRQHHNRWRRGGGVLGTGSSSPHPTQYTDAAHSLSPNTSQQRSSAAGGEGEGSRAKTLCPGTGSK